MPQQLTAPLVEAATETPYLGLHYTVEEATKATLDRPAARVFDLDGREWRHDPGSGSLAPMAAVDPGAARTAIETALAALRAQVDGLIRPMAPHHAEPGTGERTAALTPLADRAATQIRLLMLVCDSDRRRQRHMSPDEPTHDVLEKVKEVWCKVFCDD